MVRLTVDGIKVEVPDGTTLLEAAQKACVKVPTLCAWQGGAAPGACRVCVVEVEGAPRLVAACNTLVEEGMKVLTHSPRVMAARRMNVELILAEHECKCLECAKNGKCALQALAERMGVLNQRFVNEPVGSVAPTRSERIIRNDAKCVKCLRCVKVCADEKKLNIWRWTGSGKYARITVIGDKRLEDTACDFCGKCVEACPTAALTFKEEQK